MNLEEIPFDADCIDEQMIPTAFTLDTKEFQINSTKDTCFEGKLYGQRVIFSDPNDQSNWMNTSYNNLLDSIGHVPVKDPSSFPGIWPCLIACALTIGFHQLTQHTQ